MKQVDAGSGPKDYFDHGAMCLIFDSPSSPPAGGDDDHHNNACLTKAGCTGWCMYQDVEDNNNGQTRLHKRSGFNAEKCYNECKKHADATACEWGPYGCYKHTTAKDHGATSGKDYSDYTCWVF